MPREKFDAGLIPFWRENQSANGNQTSGMVSSPSVLSFGKWIRQTDGIKFAATFIQAGQSFGNYLKITFLNSFRSLTLSALHLSLPRYLLHLNSEISRLHFVIWFQFSLPSVHSFLALFISRKLVAPAAIFLTAWMNEGWSKKERTANSDWRLNFIQLVLAGLDSLQFDLKSRN